MRIKGEGIYIDSAGVFHKIKGKSIISDDAILQSLQVSGKLLFDKITCDEVNVYGKCKGGSVYAKNFFATGKIKAYSIKADEVIIKSRSGSIDELQGIKIKIFDGVDENAELFAKIFSKQDEEFDDNSRVRIGNINADTVELENCTVEAIKCKDAVIGTNCAIKELFVSGECTVAPDSTVVKTIRT